MKWYEVEELAGRPFVHPSAPDWALGLITVPVAGQPIPITINVGEKDGRWMGQPRCVRQLLISPKPSNRGSLYLCRSGYNRNATNGVVLCVPCGTVGAIPVGCLLEGPRLNVEILYLDAEYDNDGGWITGIYG